MVKIRSDGIIGNERKTRKSLPSKTFKIRNSLITDLIMENDNIKSIYHLFVAIFIGLFLNSIVGNYVKKGEIDFGIAYIVLGFQKIHIVLLTWIVFFTVACLCYFIFKFWLKLRENLTQNQNVKILWDVLSTLFLIGYFLLSLVWPSFVVFYFDLPPPSAAIVVIEQARFFMKIYAFIRTNVPKVTSSENFLYEPGKLPEFSNYLYFLFVPTLIYQYEYPRTKEIRWKFVAQKIVEIISIIVFNSLLIDRYFYPSYHDLGIRKFTLGEIILSFFENTIAGILTMLFSFYMMLHCWLNLFAELLRFGDRMFYKDWWTATTIPEFFSKWNLVVNSWFYTYIYKDLCEKNIKINASTAKLIVFVFSAILHEILIGFIFKFFLPALLVEYLIFGVMGSFVCLHKRSLPNFVYWYGFAFGIGHLMSLYSMELFTRINVPEERNIFYDFFVPRLFNTSIYLK